MHEFSTKGAVLLNIVANDQYRISDRSGELTALGSHPSPVSGQRLVPAPKKGMVREEALRYQAKASHKSPTNLASGHSKGPAPHHPKQEQRVHTGGCMVVRSASQQIKYTASHDVND